MISYLDVGGVLPEPGHLWHELFVFFWPVDLCSKKKLISGARKVIDLISSFDCCWSLQQEKSFQGFKSRFFSSS